jgi:hypothetical protein
MMMPGMPAALHNKNEATDPIGEIRNKLQRQQDGKKDVIYYFIMSFR